MKMTDLKYTTCSSPYDPTIGAHVGVQIKHIPSGVVASNVTEKTQYANKQVALKQLETHLDGYDLILPLSRFKREMNKIFRKFEQDTWKLILITQSKKPLLVVSKYCKQTSYI